MSDTTNIQEALNILPRAQFIDARLPEEVEGLEADKERRNLKNTKANRGDIEKIRSALGGEWVKYQFDARVKGAHEDDWLTHDPVWNPAHPHHQAVNDLIDRGVPAPEAVERVANGEEVLPKFVATEKQVAFIESLLAEREFDGVTIETVQGTKVIRSKKTGSIAEKRDASKLIDVLKAAPRKVAPKVEDKGTKPAGLDLSDLPAGLYGVPNGETRLKVRVEHGKPGTRWEGWTFVKDGAEYGQQKRYGLQRPGQGYQGEIVPQLEAIKADPQEAMKEYGRLTGRCGNCNRPLEDEDSVARGIGPICAANLGW